tara:strand:+ start:1144 stop:1524 length:381 start_codon:yes stop_codon:yes gene_type:complete
MEQLGQTQVAQESRTVLDGVGHRFNISLRDDALILCDAMAPENEISFSKLEAEILHAFLSVCLRMPRDAGRREELGNGRYVELVDATNPHIQLHNDQGRMEIHPASWELVLCEITLLLPRMRRSHV